MAGPRWGPLRDPWQIRQLVFDSRTRSRAVVCGSPAGGAVVTVAESAEEEGRGKGRP